VLAVDRDDAAAAVDELAARHEALLVRERERDVVLDGPERRVDAGEADDRVQDDVRRGAFEQLREVAADLLQRRVHVVERRRAGRRGAELERRMRLDDLDRLAPDRAGGAEEGDALHYGQCTSGCVRDSGAWPRLGPGPTTFGAWPRWFTSTRTRARDRTPPARQRAAHPHGPARRRGRRAGGRCP